MTEPDDFGFSPASTLAHVGNPTPHELHSPFWNRWLKEVREHEARLNEWTGEPYDPGDPSGSHWYESIRSTRIGAMLTRPPEGTPVKAGLVTLHGSGVPESLDDEPNRWQRIADKGVLVLSVRVRGYPGSMADTGDLLSTPEGWVTHGLSGEIIRPDDALGWIVPQAVADVVNGVRALRREIGPAAPMYLRGESLGGGLAIIAAAQLSRFDPIDRLVVGLPTFGDWPWRAGRRCAGTGGQIDDYIVALREYEEDMRAKLRLCDTVVHATRLRSRTLCKLAERDDVVPAPSAAGVFNALDSDPGRKWRFVVPYGHFDGGLKNARRHAMFERCAEAFLDPNQRPTIAMHPWEPLMHDGERMPDGSSPMQATQGALFGADETDQKQDTDRALVDAYAEGGRTLDDLPYTHEFERLYTSVNADALGLSRRDVFHRLHNLRKAGKLARLGRAPTSGVKLEPDEEALLVGLVEQFVGTLGQRDRLPFTTDFDILSEQFNARTGRKLDQHAVWRLIAKLAK